MHRARRSPTQVELLAGVAFWILLSLVAAALPVTSLMEPRVESGTPQLWPQSSSGGPAVGGLGRPDWNHRELANCAARCRGTGPWPTTPASSFRRSSAGLVFESFRANRFDWLGLPRRAMLAGCRLLRASTCSLAGTLVALRTGKSLRTVLRGGLPAARPSRTWRSAPLGWLMSVVYSVEWWVTLGVRVAAVHDANGVAAAGRDARHVHADHRGARGGRGQARSVYRQAQPPGQGDRGRHRAGDAGAAPSELEALEWGGLLHDVGKIGVPDNVLLKQER